MIAPFLFACLPEVVPAADHQSIENESADARLDGKGMLERLRGKRLAFVGDSLNRNMWASLICILWSSVEDKRSVRWAMGRRNFGIAHAGGFTFTVKLILRTHSPEVLVFLSVHVCNFCFGTFVSLLGLFSC